MEIKGVFQAQKNWDGMTRDLTMSVCVYVCVRVFFFKASLPRLTYYYKLQEKSNKIWGVAGDLKPNSKFDENYTCKDPKETSEK